MKINFYDEGNGTLTIAIKKSFKSKKILAKLKVSKQLTAELQKHLTQIIIECALEVQNNHESTEPISRATFEEAIIIRLNKEK